MDFGPPRIFKAIDLSIFRFKTRKNDNSRYSFKKTLLKLIDSILVSWKLHSWLFENSEINIYVKVFERKSDLYSPIIILAKQWRGEGARYNATSRRNFPISTFILDKPGRWIIMGLCPITRWPNCRVHTPGYISAETAIPLMIQGSIWFKTRLRGGSQRWQFHLRTSW